MDGDMQRPTPDRGLTSFFYDAETWQALQAIIPRLFAGKTATDQVRVWVAGCASGEEAYSVTMLLLDHARTLDHPPSIQVFATDSDEHAIARARRGVYPQTIATEIAPEHLERFFTREEDHYRVEQELKAVVLFAVHNLLHDPPFSRLDLVSCRSRMAIE